MPFTWGQTASPWWWYQTTSSASVNSFYLYQTQTATTSASTGTAYWGALTAQQLRYQQATQQQIYQRAQRNQTLARLVHGQMEAQRMVANPRAGRDYAAAVVRSHPTTAQERARELLLSQLNPDQRHTFERNNWFVVEGGKSKQRYRIRVDASLVANVDLLEMRNGIERVTHRLCAHLRFDAAPLMDHLLSQKLMLEASEDEFLRLANRHAA